MKHNWLLPLIVVMVAVAVVCATTMVLGAGGKATHNLSIRDCKFIPVDSQIVYRINVIDSGGSVWAREWKEGGTDAIILVTLKVTRPTPQRVDFDGAEFTFAFYANECDNKERCHGMLLSEDMPSLSSNIQLVGPKEPGMNFGMHWNATDDDNFFLVLAMQTNTGISDGELLIAAPSGIHWNKEGDAATLSAN